MAKSSLSDVVWGFAFTTAAIQRRVERGSVPVSLGGDMRQKGCMTRGVGQRRSTSGALRISCRSETFLPREGKGTDSGGSAAKWTEPPAPLKLLVFMHPLG